MRPALNRFIGTAECSIRDEIAKQRLTRAALSCGERSPKREDGCAPGWNPRPRLRAFVAVTDREWFEHPRHAGELDEVNFWQPSAGGEFKALAPGELFLFKLHSPDNFIVGGGLFSHHTRLRVSFAWEAFGTGNGAESLPQLRDRIERYRRIKPASYEDYEIGCILIQNPFFFSPDDWLPVPDCQPNIVRGKIYDLTRQPGIALWLEIQ